MIQYDFGRWGLAFAWRINGSVVPRAGVMAAPCALLTVFLQYLFVEVSYQPPPVKDGMAIFQGFTFVLGFLSVFRSQFAYSRFKEGLVLVSRISGAWLNATSNLMSFANTNPEFKSEVQVFQFTLVQLVSLLHCVAMQHLGLLNADVFETLGVDALNPKGLRYLADSHDRAEVVLEWLQRLIVDGHRSKTVSIDPPILSRVFQELSNGIVDLGQANCITDFPFPFPYAQMLTFMLVIHWITTPFLCAALLPDFYIGGAIVAFTTTLSLWSLHYIAAEIEMPFGDDPNDLPLTQLQNMFNRKLLVLIDEPVKSSIGRVDNPAEAGRKISAKLSLGDLLSKSWHHEERLSAAASSRDSAASRMSMFRDASSKGARRTTLWRQPSNTFQDNLSRQLAIFQAAYAKVKSSEVGDKGAAGADGHSDLARRVSEIHSVFSSRLSEPLSGSEGQPTTPGVGGTHDAQPVQFAVASIPDGQATSEQPQQCGVFKDSCAPGARPSEPPSECEPPLTGLESVYRTLQCLADWPSKQAEVESGNDPSRFLRSGLDANSGAKHANHSTAQYHEEVRAREFSPQRGDSADLHTGPCARSSEQPFLGLEDARPCFPDPNPARRPTAAVSNEDIVGDAPLDGVIFPAVAEDESARSLCI